MKKLATIVALAGILISGPALAQNAKNGAQGPAATNGQSPDGVYWRGTKRGQDPDWFIRFQILRDAEAAHT